MTLTIDERGYIVNIIGKGSKKDYAGEDCSSPLLMAKSSSFKL
ncbi:hypothetical protein [Sphingobacterium sp.]|nr:hypothetical protein [Sphingobacterium sp.]WET67274.1 MAG: hypothetical protein P0Y57_15660 [Sphingobacterium sp.]